MVNKTPLYVSLLPYSQNQYGVSGLPECHMQEATRSNCLKTIALPILIHSLLFKASAEHVLLKMLNSEPLHPACLRLKTLKNLPYLDTLPCSLSQIRECRGRGRHFQGSEVQYLLCAVKGRGGEVSEGGKVIIRKRALSREINTDIVTKKPSRSKLM